MSTINIEFVLRALKAMQECDCHDELWWQISDDNQSIKFTVGCSDVFWWGCADSEDLTPDNINVLEQAVVDMKEVIAQRGDDSVYLNLGLASTLFVARVRKMRPQGAMYSYIHSKLWALFDACGPERELGGGNTAKPDFNEHVRKENEWAEKRKQILGEKEKPVAPQQEDKTNVVQRAYMWLLDKIEGK